MMCPWGHCRLRYMSSKLKSENTNNSAPKKDFFGDSKPAKGVDVPEKEIKKSGSRLIKGLIHYQFLIVLIVIISALGLVIISMSQIFNTATDVSGYDEASTVITFDKKTVQQIEALDASASQPPIIDTEGRNNPFAPAS